jgi:hypothetical protein
VRGIGTPWGLDLAILRPQLNVVCGRCGKPRSLRHVCIGNRTAKATFKPQWSFGKCPKCKKDIGNPLTHTCAPKSDFKKRRARFEREAKAKAAAEARKKRQADKHDYQACPDPECKRSLCAAFKTGYRLGDETGFERGFELGYSSGFQDGIEACPRNHAG